MKRKLFLSFYIIFTLSINGQTNLETSWRFYRPGNTGIQGDYATALWIDNEGNPYIAANTGNWGEGGFAKLEQATNKWLNYSNVDLPILGGFDNGDIGIQDIVEDSNHRLWMAKKTGAIYFDPAVGASSIINYDSTNSALLGYSTDIDIAPDGSVWFVSDGLVRYIPQSDNWTMIGGASPRVTVQPKPDGSYIVWSADTYYGYVFQYNSATGANTFGLPATLGDVAGLPGKDCVDNVGNFWALRMAQNGDWETLEFQRPNGEWVHPAHPYTNFSFYINDFKAFGEGKAVMVLNSGETWFFDGTTWLNYGTWRSGDNNLSVDADAAGSVWVCGVGGAAKRDVNTGLWQRFRLTNTSQIDYFVEDMTIDNDGSVWMTGNAGTGVGGIQKYDGSSWTGFNPYTYGLGQDFPFMADSSTAITCRQSTNDITFSPTFHGVHTWNGSAYTTQEGELITSKGLVEDSQGKLWSLGEYYNYRLYNDVTNQWTDLPIVGWAQKIVKDPVLQGTVWVVTDSEIVRTNGTTAETMYAGVISGFALANDGIFWTSTNTPGDINAFQIFRHNINTGLIHSWTYGTNWPFPAEDVHPLACSPDGRVWMQYNSAFPSLVAGLVAFDGTNVELFPSAVGGFPDWNVLPNAIIKEIEVKTIENGYELWISCLGRGVAVLTVMNSVLGVNPVSEQLQSRIKVYPNPASEKVTISFNNVTNESTEISIYDIAGRLITTLTNESNLTGLNYLNWNLTTKEGTKVSNGLYIIKMKTASQSMSTRLIVK